MERWLELAVIVGAAWLPLRAAASSRFALAYPDLARRLRAALALVASLAVAVAWFAPNLLRAAALAAVVVAVAERWRARARWGRSRGLPPGSLGILPETWANDRFYLERAKRYGPIFKTSNFLRPTICVVGLDRGLELLRDHEASLATPRLPFADFVPGELLRYMDGERHRHYRKVLRPAFGPQVFEAQMERVAGTVRRTLEAIAQKSEAEAAGVHPLPFLDPLMLDLWFPLFFAIERGSERAAELRSLYPVIDIDNPTRASPDQIRNAVRGISTCLEEQLDAWRDAGAPACILGHVMAAHESDARDPAVLGNLIYLVHTSSTDMSALLCWLLKMMSDHPVWLEHVAEEANSPNPEPPLSLATRIVMETLRMRQSEFLYRELGEDVEFHGFRLPAGWLLRICVWESHRDPKVFDEPDRFDPDRFLGERGHARDEYSPFGGLSHACLAPQLVTRVGSVFVSELARGFRLETISAGTLELGSYRHWRPSSDYRIRLTERT